MRARTNLLKAPPVMKLAAPPALKVFVQSPLTAPHWPAQHVLLVLPAPTGRRLPAGLPPDVRAALQVWMKRRNVLLAKLAGQVCVLQVEGGTQVSLCWLDASDTAFKRGTALRKALAPLLQEHPQVLVLAAEGLADQDRELAVYTTLVNAAALPQRKSTAVPAPLRQVQLMVAVRPVAALLARAEALAAGNTLTRALTVLPPNELTPAAYRQQVKALAAGAGWKHSELDMAALRRRKAGAFVAVAQGSRPEDAAIVHLVLKPRGATRRLALVGKGICFDTGGHNLKSARYMYGMHEDMNGSAVALGALHALAALNLPVEIHCFLALAQNHLSPAAYKQNDVVTALNGTTIEIVHTDAEGRMVLADTLTLASQVKPELVIDYATLTGSMVGALGTRQSGVFASRPALEPLVQAASQQTGERMVCFPAWDDYDAELDSRIADVKQCLQAGEADHILAARFLSRFVGKHDWLHVDLSCYRNEGGLGAVASDVNGFGVAWTVALVQSWLKQAAAAQ